jgi:Tetracyclin repressor-like, C-terminal domain
VYAILRGYGLDEDETVHATRAVRSALHGFVVLEAAGGFGLPQDVDESYARLVDLLDSGLGRGSGSGSGSGRGRGSGRG